MQILHGSLNIKQEQKFGYCKQLFTSSSFYPTMKALSFLKHSHTATSTEHLLKKRWHIFGRNNTHLDEYKLTLLRPQLSVSEATAV